MHTPQAGAAGAGFVEHAHRDGRFQKANDKSGLIFKLSRHYRVLQIYAINR